MNKSEKKTNKKKKKKKKKTVVSTYLAVYNPILKLKCLHVNFNSVN